MNWGSVLHQWKPRPHILSAGDEMDQRTGEEIPISHENNADDSIFDIFDGLTYWMENTDWENSIQL